MNASSEGFNRNERLSQRDSMLEKIQENYRATAILREKLGRVVEHGDFGNDVQDALEKELDQSDMPPRYKEIAREYGRLTMEDAATINDLRMLAENDPEAESRTVREICGFEPKGNVRLVYELTRVRVYFEDVGDFYGMYYGLTNPDDSLAEDNKDFAGFYRRFFGNDATFDVCCGSTRAFSDKTHEWISLPEDSLEELMLHEEQHAFYARMRRARYIVDAGAGPEIAVAQAQRVIASQAVKAPTWYDPGSSKLDAESIPGVVKQLYHSALDLASENAADEMLAVLLYSSEVSETLDKLRQDDLYGSNYVRLETDRVLNVLSRITGLRNRILKARETEHINKDYVLQVMEPLKEALEMRMSAGVHAIRDLMALEYSPQEIIHFLVLEPLISWPKIAKRIERFPKKVLTHP